MKSSFLKDSLYTQLMQGVKYLHNYTGKVVPLLGKLIVKVENHKAIVILPLLVVKGAVMTLLGRDWL